MAIFGSGGSGMNTRSEHVLAVRETGADATEKKLRKVEKSTESLAKTVAKYAAGYFSVRGVLAAATGAVRAYERQELAERKLAKAAGASTAALIQQASALQRVTRYGDEAVIEAQQLLATMGVKGTQQLKMATEATVELASVMGWDLTQAARNVGKTFGGFAGELGEVLPALKSLTKEQLQAGEGAKLLIKLYGGSAAADVNSLSGAIAQASNAMSDLGEVIGGAVAPAVEYMAVQVKDLAQELTRLSSGDWVNILADLVEFTSPAGQPLAASLRGRAKGMIRADAAQRMAASSAGTAAAAAAAAPAARRSAAGGRGGGASGFGTELSLVSPIDAQIIAEDKLREQQESRAALLARIHESQMQAFVDEGQAAEELARKREEDARRAAEMQAENARMMRDNIMSAASSAAQAWGGFFQQLVGSNSKAANRISKALLFMEGAMAVSRGVIALQESIATSIATKGASLIQIPAAAALIASGSAMMAGSFLSAGRARSGGGGGGGNGMRLGPGARDTAAGRNNVVVNVNVGGVVHSQGEIGEYVSMAVMRARAEGRKAI